MQLEMKLFGRCADTFKDVEARVFGVEPDLECQSVRVCRAMGADWCQLLRQAGGYELQTAETILDIPELPKIIHSIKGDRSHLSYLHAFQNSAWATPYSRSIGNYLEDLSRLQEWLCHQSLASQQILLHQETKDALLERLFGRTFHPNFFSMLGSVSNCISIAPGYSVYDNGSMCRHHQLYNLKRSTDFFVRACKQGIRCIPSLGWNREEDLNRIADWINLQPTLRHVAINCQTIRSNQFAKVSEAMLFIEAKARPLRWVVFGGPKVSRHLNAQGFVGRLHLVTATHIQAARAGRNLDLSYLPKDKTDLILNNYKVIACTFPTLEVSTST